jgi:methylmalonyl-CoA mutase C-terminal domain/subunit
MGRVPGTGPALREGAISLKGKRILIALALRDAGADVIYTGLRKSPAHIARVAVDEDVDAVGLSILSGSHKELVVETVARLADLNAGDIKVFVGGTIPPTDHEELKTSGAAGVFTAEMKIDDVLAEMEREMGS